MRAGSAAFLGKEGDKEGREQRSATSCRSPGVRSSVRSAAMSAKSLSAGARCGPRGGGVSARDRARGRDSGLRRDLVAHTLSRRQCAPGPGPGRSGACLQHALLPVRPEDAAGPGGQGDPVSAGAEGRGVADRALGVLFYVLWRSILSLCRRHVKLQSLSSRHEMSPTAAVHDCSFRSPLRSGKARQQQ